MGNKSSKSKSKRKAREPEFNEFTFRWQKWTLPKHYRTEEYLGEGSQGAVLAATNRRTNEGVAIKKMVDPFKTADDGKRTYREIRLLQQMKHPNILLMLDLFTTSTSMENFDEVYLVTPLLTQTLHERMVNNQMEENDISKIMYDILLALKYLHSADIIHRDVKPANLAIATNGTVRLLDFGLARQKRELMTEEVTTLVWRAPEIIYNWCRYDSAVDIWSLGCIMAHMILGRPLFSGGQQFHLLQKILLVVGVPDQDFVDTLPCKTRSYIDEMKEAHNGCKKVSFENLFSRATPIAVDLLNKLLDVNPNNRPCAGEILAHPFLAAHRGTREEPDLINYHWMHESEEHTAEEWQSLCWDEIQNFVAPSPEVLSAVWPAEERLPWGR